MRKSIIWKMGDEEFSSLVKKSRSYSEVVRSFGLAAVGSGGFAVLKKRIRSLGLDCSHMRQFVSDDRANRLKKMADFLKRPTNEILVENSSYVNANKLKQRLVKEGLLEYKCAKCGIDRWNGVELSLHMDHINRDKRDNRIQNLRILCPNCHSQTSTYAGKKNKLDSRCKSCGGKIPRASQKIGIVCEKCSHFAARKVKNRPVKEVLQHLVWEKPTLHVAKEFGVSDNAVAKWCKSYGIEKPPRGYWRQQECKKAK